MAEESLIEKKRREVMDLAEGLSFQPIPLEDFEQDDYLPEKVRMKRDYSSKGDRQDPVSRFLTDFGRVDLLTSEQGHALFAEMHWAAWSIQRLAEIKGGTEENWVARVRQARTLVSEVEAAEEELFLANRRLVAKCIQPYSWIGRFWLSDFIQEGAKALTRSIRRFDYSRGTPFYAYAHIAVNNRLRNFMRDHVRSGSIAMRPSQDMLALKSIVDNWVARGGDMPSNSLLARLSGFTEKRVTQLLPLIKQMERQLGAPLSLDAELTEDHADMYQFVKDEKTVSADGEAERSEIWDAIESLAPREGAIMKMRFLEGKTLEEVGSVLGLTRARIKQIQDASLKKLRVMLGQEEE